MGKHMLRRLLTAFLLLSVSLVLCLPNASLAGSEPAKDDFQITIAPYAWLTGMYGTVGLRDAQSNVDSSFADLSKYLNFATMLHLDMIYKDTFGILGEINYSLLGDQSSKKNVGLKSQMWLVLSDMAAFYRLGTVSLGKDGKVPASFDILAGARLWSLGMHVNAEGDGISRTIYKQTTWVDPIVGGRIQIGLSDKWTLFLRGGVGGFGWTSGITWDAMAVVGYTFWEHGTAVIGYRAVGVNHTEGSGRSYFKYDVTLSGPIIGASFTF